MRNEAPLVMIVEDTRDSLDLMDDILRSRGYRTLRASSGPEAVRILRWQKPDLIVLDIMMPDMNGFAVLDVIRGTPCMERTPAIIVTADPSHENGQRAVNAGLQYMLCKPVDITLLLRAVKNLVGTPAEAMAVH